MKMVAASTVSAALATVALATMMVACDENKVESSKEAAISLNSTDDQKFAFMLGAQFGGQNFIFLPRQVGEELNKDALFQGIRDNMRHNADTSFKIQMTGEDFQKINMEYTAVARKRAEEIRPDSALLASGDNEKIRAYVDSMGRLQPIAKADPFTGAEVKITAESSNNVKFSYMMGIQMANQLITIGSQLESKFDAEYMILGIQESSKKVADSTYAMTLPEDSLKAVGFRYQDKLTQKRSEAQKKFEEEEQKLKQEVAPLRGDTLANGMPAKINYKVKTTAVSVQKTLGEKIADFSIIAGKPAFVFYFSATCGHCAHAAPEVLKLAKEFEKSGLVTLAVASGSNQKVGIRKFMDNAKWDESMNVLFDESREFGELYSDGYVPKFYLVNPDGSYKLFTSIENQFEEMKQDIKGVLAGKNVEWKVEVDSTKAAK